MSDMPERDLELACRREIGERLGQPFETLEEKAARLEAEQRPQPIVRATRYSCPLPGCGWTYDAPAPSIDAGDGIESDPAAVTLQDVMASVAAQATLRHVQGIETVLADHFASHDLAEWVLALTNAQEQRTADTTSVWHVEAGRDGRWRPVAGPFPARSIAIADLEWRRTTAPPAIAHRLRRTDTTRTTTVEET